MPSASPAGTRSACAVVELGPAQEVIREEAETRWLRLVGGLRGKSCFFWLDSASRGARNGRYSFAGAEPWAVSRVFGARIETRIERPRIGAPPARAFGDALDAARALLPPAPEVSAPLPAPFVGGVVGYLGYEAANPWNDTPVPFGASGGVPDATWLGVDRLWAIDHLEGRLFAVALEVAAEAADAERAAEAAVREMVSRVPDGPTPPCPPAPAAAREHTRLDWSSGFDIEGHAKALERVRERIVAGDVYQACLTHRLDVRFDGDPFALYGALRTRNPAPFAAYLELPDLTWVGSSPERFLSAGPNGWLESRPIKGTRPRGADAERDRALRRELEGSQKDRAENLMIVDLVRNDLGRVAELGSVHVPELFHLEAHPTVFQSVSTVRARLREGADVLDAVRAAFPPGSMTGAPKIAAMEILRALEPDRRGPYAGALGYLDARGAADLSVVIRTAFVRDGRAWLHTGGGIVHDSEPGAEWDEATVKASPLVDAIEAVSAGTARGEARP